MKSFRLGIFAEYIAMLLYAVRFYGILHHRMKTYVGEVDLVIARGRQLVFVEVKARKNGICEGIVSSSQQNRITKAAELFISRNSRFAGYDVRFDLVVIEPYKWPVIIQNAW
ncbi:MAG: hypothetical protein COA94_02740 [Rickettsiales bacterium]|nr:MAG: hypothetical protein COA94_02740 [Rickettsiales bacterium]